MKTSIVILDGAAQLVLTPETDFEKEILNKVPTGPVNVKRGTFFKCGHDHYRYGEEGTDDDESLILTIGDMGPRFGG